MNVHLRDFNPDTRGIADSGQAFRKAIDYLKNLDEKLDKKLIVDKGTYRISKEFSNRKLIHISNTSTEDYPEKHIGILVKGVSNLEIVFDKANLLIEGDMMAIAFVKCENIKVSGLSWDYKIPTTSEMSLIEINEEEKFLEFYIDPCLDFEIKNNKLIWYSEKDSKGDYYWIKENHHDQCCTFCARYDKSNMTRRYAIEYSPFMDYEEIVPIEQNTFRIYYDKLPQIKLEKGMHFQFMSNWVRDNCGALVTYCKNMTFKNLTISYMHGFGFLVQMSRDIFFDKTLIKGRKGRYTSSFADGIHVSGCGGKFEIINSKFDNTLDDPINIHGTYTKLQKIEGDLLYLSYMHHQQAGFRQFNDFDDIVFYNADNLEKLIDRPIPIKKYMGFKHQSTKEMIVKIDKKDAEYLKKFLGQKTNIVCENLTYCPEILIKNNEFSNIATRCILATSSKKTIIEDNVFHGSSLATLYFSNDAMEWYESGPIKDLTIRKNIFNVKSIGREAWDDAPAIFINPIINSKSIDPNTFIHQNIKIENNIFNIYDESIIRAKFTSNIQFINNLINVYNHGKCLYGFYFCDDIVSRANKINNKQKLDIN